MKKSWYSKRFNRACKFIRVLFLNQELTKKILKVNIDIVRSSKRPNLFIIGAMKSGTSSLSRYLESHPSICICHPREPSYFVKPDQIDWPQIKELKLWKNEDKYLSLFKSTNESKILIDASTLYTKRPAIDDVAERIATFSPDARFIYVMRDPIERTISHYWHEVKRGNEYLDLLTAVHKNPLYRDTSNYAMQLEPYLEQFSRHHFFLLTSEEMLEDPEKIVRQIFQWLDIDESYQPKNLNENFHVTQKIITQRSRIYQWRRVWPFNTIISNLPMSLRYFGQSLTTKKIDRSTQIEALESAARYLRPIQQSQTQVLSNLLGRNFQCWKTLYRGASLNA